MRGYSGPCKTSQLPRTLSSLTAVVAEPRISGLMALRRGLLSVPVYNVN